jgi:hypothetical protein
MNMIYSKRIEWKILVLQKIHNPLLRTSRKNGWLIAFECPSGKGIEIDSEKSFCLLCSAFFCKQRLLAIPVIVFQKMDLIFIHHSSFRSYFHFQYFSYFSLLNGKAKKERKIQLKMKTMRFVCKSINSYVIYLS